jgi:hypothetical protein
MTPRAKMSAIVDLEGNILAAQLLNETSGYQDGETPSATLLPLKGQYAITIEVPEEALNLSGLDLQRFLSQTRIRFPADIQLPNVEVSRKD